MKEHLSKYRTSYLVFLLLGFLMIMVSSALRPEDHYCRNFRADDLLLNAGSNQIKDGSGYSGMVTSGPMVSLAKGVYDITVAYNAQADGNIFQLWDADADIGAANIHMEGDGSLPASQNNKTVRVIFDENISNLEICTFYGGQGDFSVNGITIECVEGSANVRDSIILPILFYIAALVWYLCFIRMSKERQKDYLIISFTVILSGLPCFLNYLVDGHDMPFEVNRIVGIASGLKSGQFPVRIHASTFSGYGYAASVFYPELLLYIPAVLYLAGVSLTASIHIYLFILNALAAGVMYFVTTSMFKSHKVGLYSSILYTFALYRLVLVYLMNGYGSAAAMVFIPLVIYGFYEIIAGDRKKWGYLVVGMTGVLQTHVISLFVTVIFLAATVLVSLFWVRQPKRYIELIKAAVVTIFLNLWFIVPFLSFYFSELDTASLSGNPAGRALSLANLLSVWGHFGWGIQIVNRPADRVPALIDLSLLAGIVCLLIQIFGEEKESERKKALMLLGVSVIAIYMTTKYFPWKSLQDMKFLGKLFCFIQHPQRILCIAIPCLCMAVAYGYAKFGQDRKEIFLIVFITAALTSMSFLQEYSVQDVKYAKGEIMSTYPNTKEYLYPDTNTGNLVANQYIVSDANIAVEAFEKEGTNIEFYYSAQIEGYIELPLFYYPGYRVTCNGERIKTERGNNNQMRIPVDAETGGKVKLSYRGFPAWKVADMISILTMIGCVFALIFYRKRNRLIQAKKYHEA